MYSLSPEEFFCCTWIFRGILMKLPYCTKFSLQHFEINMTPNGTFDACRNAWFRDCSQISLLKLSEFEQINLCSPWNHHTFVGFHMISGWIKVKLFARQIFAILTIFFQIWEIKSSRKINLWPIHGVKSTQIKSFFLSFFRISKSYIFTLRSPSDGHVKNILQNIKQYE